MATPAWLSAVERLAPTIASAFGTPVAGMAVSALESVLGITGTEAASTDDRMGKIQQALEAGRLTGEQIAAMKKADQDFAAQMKKLDVDLEQMQLADVASARQMQIAQPSNVPATLSSVIVVGFFGALVVMMAGINVKDNNAFLMMLGALTGALAQVLNYWFGSTRHSQTTASLNAETVATVARK
jgi:hypothetical protein